MEVFRSRWRGYSAARRRRQRQPRSAVPTIIPLRVGNLTGAFNDHPFTGAGSSVYVTVGSTVQYRNQRVVPTVRKGSRRQGWIKGSTGNHNISATSVLKTARRASAADPATSTTYTIPDSLASQDVTWDVRKYQDDVENESYNFRTVRTGLDASKEIKTEILGTAVLLDQQQRDGGIVRLRFVYLANRDGTQPSQFRAVRTAGPSTPADSVLVLSTVPRIVEIDTPALLDSGSYTYKLVAENGAVTKDLLTGVTVAADASGPPALTGVSVSSV